MPELDPVDSAIEVETGVVFEVVVSMENPKASVVAGGSVVISGAGSVTSSISAPTVYAQKQRGVSVGMKSPTVLSPKLALVYVTR